MRYSPSQVMISPVVKRPTSDTKYAALLPVDRKFVGRVQIDRQDTNERAGFMCLPPARLAVHLPCPIILVRHPV